MKVKTIQSSWIRNENLRLDSGPYMSGALEARIRLERLSVRKDRLDTLTAGFNGGIYNGPQFRRNYVDSLEYGVPFLTSGTILRADLSNLPLLRRKDAESPQLSYLQLRQRMTLISCSGTIGRMAYARPDMDGLWSSQDVMKVVPDPAKVPTGYVYAFLASRFGVPMILARTYGAIIPHLEPQHIADLPVPRLGDAIEQRAHQLVEEAASARTRASHLLAEAEHQLFRDLAIPLPKSPNAYARPLLSATSASVVQSRLDAYYFSLPNTDSREAFDKTANERRSLGDVAEVFIPGIFKRQYVDDPQYGYPYITGADVFQISPTSERYLNSRVAHEYNLVLRKGMILVHEAGQIGGLIGRSTLVGEYLDNFACTNNMIRIMPHDEQDTGFIFCVLSSEYGVRLIARESAGSSIPHIEVSRVRNIEIPWPDTRIRQSIGVQVLEARSLRDQACNLESEARNLVEQAIEEAA